jgi:hypothetical protein
MLRCISEFVSLIYVVNVTFYGHISILIILVERWQKIALLVFTALAFVSAKTKCTICAVGFFLIGHNVLQLKEVGDFHLKCSYEAQMFVEPQNCHTKHRVANFF